MRAAAERIARRPALGGRDERGAGGAAGAGGGLGGGERERRLAGAGGAGDDDVLAGRERGGEVGVDALREPQPLALGRRADRGGIEEVARGARRGGRGRGLLQ